MPDATVLLDVTAEHADERRDPRVADRIEREPIEFHRNVVAAYEERARPRQRPVVRVDGTGDAGRGRRARARGARV